MPSIKPLFVHIIPKNNLKVGFPLLSDGIGQLRIAPPIVKVCSFVIGKLCIGTDPSNPVFGRIIGKIRGIGV